MQSEIFLQGTRHTPLGTLIVASEVLDYSWLSKLSVRWEFRGGRASLLGPETEWVDGEGDPWMGASLLEGEETSEEVSKLGKAQMQEYVHGLLENAW